MYLLVKTLITALIVVGISELARRYSLMAAILASLPLTSVLAFTWIYLDSKNNEQIARLSWDVFWLVIPSLLFFVVLPVALRMGWHYAWALLAACTATALGYGLFIALKAFVAR